MRVYTVRMDNTAVTSNITLVQIKPGVSSIVLLRAKIGQNSDAATSAMQDVAIGCSTGAATVTSATPRPHFPSSAAQAAYAVGGTSATGINASGEGSTQTDTKRDSFNLLTGFEWVPTPEERIEVQGGGAQYLYMRLPIAPGSSTTVNAELTFGEIG